MARIKKAQGGSKVDNTRVKKPIIDPVRTTPTKYKYIDRPVPSGKKPSSIDSALYRSGYKRGVKGGNASVFDNWQEIEGVREGRENRPKKQKNGGSTPAWQRKEGKNPSGGLNAKGRASYNRANPGSNLKAPQPEGGPRKRSFCARMSGVKGPMKKPNGEPTRKALALRKWKC
jgi:hypothetical protein